MGKKTKEKTKLIIFDFDGVIIDSVEVMFKNMQKLFPGLTWEEFQEGTKSPIKERDEYFTSLHHPLSKEKAEIVQKMYANEKFKYSLMHPGMKMVLKDLGKKYYLAINTNARPANLLPILKNEEIHNFFDVIESGGTNQTKVDKSESIMSDLGVSPHNSIFVTDTTGDVLDAEEAGMPAIAVIWGVHRREHFEEGEVGDGVLAIVESSDELYDSISEHFKQ